MRGRFHGIKLISSKKFSLEPLRRLVPFAGKVSSHQANFIKENPVFLLIRPRHCSPYLISQVHDTSNRGAPARVKFQKLDLVKGTLVVKIF